ncbi:MAG: DUF3880 domain-containing protein [Clostridium sp.]|nr:DUF3880 domain-containing protein [Clostridium sp.]
MAKKVLVYRWGSASEPFLCGAVEKLSGAEGYMEFSEKIKNFHADASFAGKFIEVIHANEIGAVISYDYFPLISMICEINGIPYISWIYDCPLYTLQSKTISNNCNYIFCFDGVYTGRLEELGAVHCYHYPLAGEPGFWEEICRREHEKPDLKGKYQCDISFVGNLYNEEKNRIRGAKLSDYTAGFAEGLIRAQLQVYGYNFLRDSLREEMAEEISRACKLSLGEEYNTDLRQLAADALGMEVSARERELALGSLSGDFPVRLYTASKIPASLCNKNLQKMGYADYQREVPLIYHNSRINLNITSKTIEAGIPQRVFDILSCKGFCLTNYQPEIADCFADGEELVIYTGMEDLAQKAAYYLQHEEERARIAENGYRKIVESFSFEERVGRMLGEVLS